LSLSDDRLEDEVVKIVTEALSNALRHSRGTKIEVVVLDEDGWYRIMVRDDGLGFDPAARRAGLGLANLSARASNLGGIVEITSSPGRGTTVEVKLPLS
jgi:NarL family two-component system sensor histidine kinase LiaS